MLLRCDIVETLGATIQVRLISFSPIAAEVDAGAVLLFLYPGLHAGICLLALLLVRGSIGGSGSLSGLEVKKAGHSKE